MEAEYQLTAEEAEKEMEQLRKVFTIVRLVDANRIQVWHQESLHQK